MTTSTDGAMHVRERSARAVALSRRTRETEVEVRLDLDGDGRANVTTGVGFYDHLLTSLYHLLFHEGENVALVTNHGQIIDIALVLGALQSALMAPGRSFGVLGQRTTLEETADRFNVLVSRMVELGVLVEATGNRRNRLFRYQPYIDLFG